jgi:hypothetical protein
MSISLLGFPVDLFSVHSHRSAMSIIGPVLSLREKDHLPRQESGSDSLQRLANSLQSFAEHFGIDSHPDAEMVGQAEKPAGHG